MLILVSIIARKSLLRTKPKPVCSRNNKVLRNDGLGREKQKGVTEINAKRKR